MTETVRHVPGAETVGGFFDKMLDNVGIVSPRSRRIAAYTGAGVLGVLGAVDWPVAAAGAAAVWLTQPRPARTEEPTSRSTRRTTKTTGRAPRSTKASEPSRKTPSSRSTTRSTTERAAKRRTGSSSASAKKRRVA